MSEIPAELSRAGYAVCPGFLDADTLTRVRQDFDRLRPTFERAGIGQGTERQVRDEIRRDETLWFNPASLSEGQALIWSRLEAVREKLNQELYLGLEDFEGHYAAYPPGGFYRRHRDTFRSEDRRVVSVVLYLNRTWQKGDGGELHLYPASGVVDVEPHGGTLACFLSREIEHEVLASRVERASFAGWYRVRGV